MKKLDIHCHVLPELDDGSSDEQESLHMLRMAARQGVKAVVATPHHSVQFQNENPEEIRQKCRLLESKAQREIKKNFRIYAGQEIFYAENVLEKLNQGKLLTIGESSYILLEFHPAVPYSVMFKGVRQLIMARYLPILAHIERYAALRERGRVEELIQAGALMQMNYRKIGGKWYDESARWCRKMLKEGNIHCLGTDMHNTKERRPEIKAASEWIEKHLDDSYIEDIYYKNAERILANERI